MADPTTPSAPSDAPAPAAAPSTGAAVSSAAPTPTSAPASAAPGNGDGSRAGGDDSAARLQGYESKIKQLETELRDAKSQAGRAKTVEERLASVESELATSKADLERERGEARERTNLDKIVAKVPAKHQRAARLAAIGLAKTDGIDLKGEGAASAVEAMATKLREEMPALFVEESTGTQVRVPKHATVTNGSGAAVQAVGLFNDRGSRIA